MTTHHHLDPWQGWVTICHSWHAHKYRCFMSCAKHNSKHIHQTLLCSSHNSSSDPHQSVFPNQSISYNQHIICPKNTGSVWNSKCMHSWLLHLSLPLQALDMLAVCSFHRWRPRWALALKHNQKTVVHTGLDKNGHYTLPTLTQYNYSRKNPQICQSF